MAQRSIAARRSLSWPSSTRAALGACRRDRHLRASMACRPRPRAPRLIGHEILTARKSAAKRSSSLSHRRIDWHSSGVVIVPSENENTGRPCAEHACMQRERTAPRRSRCTPHKGLAPGLRTGAPSQPESYRCTRCSAPCRQHSPWLCKGPFLSSGTPPSCSGSYCTDALSGTRSPFRCRDKYHTKPITA